MTVTITDFKVRRMDQLSFFKKKYVPKNIVSTINAIKLNCSLDSKTIIVRAIKLVVILFRLMISMTIKQMHTNINR